MESGLVPGSGRGTKIKEGILFLLFALHWCFVASLCANIGLDWTGLASKHLAGHEASILLVLGLPFCALFSFLRPFCCYFDPIRLPSIHSNVILRGLNS